MLINLIIAILILIFAGFVVYLIRKSREEQKPNEPKQFSKEEIKRREGSYFDNKEI